MEVEFLNSSFEWIGVLDTFKSFIWRDRYSRAGDFELTTSPTTAILEMLLEAEYVRLDESPHLMFLEIVNIHWDVDDGATLLIKGRSIETILERRVVWDHIVLSGNFQTQLQGLLDDNIMDPSDSDRHISNFVFTPAYDPAITDLLIDTQYEGDDIYLLIVDLCESRDIGFQITLDGTDFKFKLYAGADRSYDQSTNPPVIFSPKLDNLSDSDYTYSNQYEKTVCLVKGETGVGNIAMTVAVPAPTGAKTGLARKEMYIEASNTSQSEAGSEEDYIAQLIGKGYEELAKNRSVTLLEGQITTEMYSYPDDFQMGDILQIVDSYGHVSKSRVTEMIFTKDLTGSKIYPSFTAIIE